MSSNNAGKRRFLEIFCMSNDPIEKLLSSAKITLFWKAPFYGAIIMNLDTVDASKWCRTFTTDGQKFYYNRDFIKKLKNKSQVIWCLAHVVGHIVFGHLGRRGSRDPNRWGAATDYLTNFMNEKELVEKAKIAERPEMDGIFYDERYNDEMTSEQIYDDLEKNSKEFEMSIEDHQDIGGSGSKKVKVTIQGGPDGPPQLSEDDLEKLREKIFSQVMTAAQVAGAGRTPAAVQRLIEQFTNPVIDWTTLLEMEIQSTIKDDFTFMNPSKRSWSIPKVNGDKNALPIIMPGHNFKKMIDIAFIIDASGSMSDEMVSDALSELKGIVEMYSDFRVVVWSFDTQIYNPKVFTPSNIEEIYDYGLVGRGGTDFEINWDFMKNPEKYGFEGFTDPIEPEKICFFTDGGCCGDSGFGYGTDGWGDPNWASTLWIIHGSTTIKPPYGNVAYYQDYETRTGQKRVH